MFDRHLPLTKEECQKKLKEEFLKNKHITDVRVIDMLVIKVHINKTFYNLYFLHKLNLVFCSWLLNNCFFF